MRSGGGGKFAFGKMRTPGQPAVVFRQPAGHRAAPLREIRPWSGWWRWDSNKASGEVGWACPTKSRPDRWRRLSSRSSWGPRLRMAWPSHSTGAN